ncbi:MAG: SsrA-binding protein SmpB [Actinobacteria bacterium]|nr:SsrA-binding protein SmpB [Actinomycetota bacterium]MBL7124449.1 SsrA-binding protein SmpB [Actinomycetota bacterium]
MKANGKNKVLIAQNKKAYKNFFIFDRYEAGIVLMGCEVKSIREHNVNLRDSYGRIKNGELFLHNMHISPYSKSRIEDLNPRRARKLLMHKREINRISGKLIDKSLTLVPLSIYMLKNIVKIEMALAKGKALRDKRKDIEKKESEMEIRRALKKFKK